ncbi:MAG: AsmA family protein, partial [Acetobacteraceae bacterium]|nr:AsmA family protein [Acetobacteraceae bacterium]
ALPVRLRLAANGPAEAVALRLEADGADARLEAQGQLDAGAGRLQGSLTLRHPGAVRLLGQLGWTDADWLGPGSLSAILSGSLQPGQATAENLELVAGALRLRGQGGLAWDGPRPRVTGRLSAERLPLPAIPTRSLAPLALDDRARFDAELSVAAEAVELPGLPVLTAATATLRGAEGAWQLDGLRGRVAGGEVQATLDLAAQAVPTLGFEGRLTGGVISAPLTGGTLDLTAGAVEGAWRLRSRGSSPAALIANLEGEAAVTLRDAVATGVDVPAIAAAGEERVAFLADAALRAAMVGGATPLDRAALRLALRHGIATLDGTELTAEGGAAATLGGALDLLRGTLDLRLAVPLPNGPDVALRLFGAAVDPLRVPEIAARLRFLAEHPPP